MSKSASPFRTCISRMPWKLAVNDSFQSRWKTFSMSPGVGLPVLAYTVASSMRPAAMWVDCSRARTSCGEDKLSGS